MSAGRAELRLGGGLLAAVALVAVAVPLVAPHDPLAVSLPERLLPPGGEHLLGTDELGRDLAARLAAGARGSLGVALLAALLSVATGLAAASVAFVFGRVADTLVFRAADLLLAFPGGLLAITVAALLGPGRRNLVLALAAAGWVGIARVARGELLRWAEAPFVEAARAAGAGRGRIFRVHLLPQLLPVAAVQGAMLVSGFVLAEGALSFLGLGLPPPHPSWGGMLDAARGHLLDAPHLAVLPALALGTTAVGLGLLADGLVARLDPARRAGGGS